MANQTATDFGVYPPRGVHVGANRMHANIVTTISASASDNMYMFQIPPDCFVVAGGIKASVPTGTAGNIVLKIGTPASDAAFGTFTVSGTAVLATKFTSLISPVTVSSSGTDALCPVVISVNSAVSSTTSLSIYLLLEYVLPGNIN
jgi:hypothetical protein